MAEPRQDAGDRGRLRDAAALAEFEGVDLPREGRRPALVGAVERDPGGDEGVLRERVGAPARQAEARRLALHVAPHVAALGGIEVERRARPALRGEDRPEQEGPPAHLDPRRLRPPLDAHGREIRIGRRELVPEFEDRPPGHGNSEMANGEW
jgi:hypothetical protein